MEYCKLSAVTIWEFYTILCMNECIHSLGDGTILLNIFATSLEWPVLVADKDPKNTAFASHPGLFRSIPVLFCLKTHLGTFQCAMYVKLSSLKWQIARVYLDEIAIISESSHKPTGHVRQGLTLLNDTRVALEHKKCAIFSNGINFLGHVLNP